jgi:hypothetical protein
MSAGPLHAVVSMLCKAGTTGPHSALLSTLDTGNISSEAPDVYAQDVPAGQQLQQLHEEAAQAAPLGRRLDLQLPAVQHRALACSAAGTDWSHKHMFPHSLCCRGPGPPLSRTGVQDERTLHLIAEVGICQLLLCPVVDLCRYMLDI